MNGDERYRVRVFPGLLRAPRILGMESSVAAPVLCGALGAVVVSLLFVGIFGTACVGVLVVVAWYQFGLGRRLEKIESGWWPRLLERFVWERQFRAHRVVVRGRGR